eukprot:2525735-Rhodomonas_salina.1
MWAPACPPRPSARARTPRTRPALPLAQRTAHSTRRASRGGLASSKDAQLRLSPAQLRLSPAQLCSAQASARVQVSPSAAAGVPCSAEMRDASALLKEADSGVLGGGEEAAGGGECEVGDGAGVLALEHCHARVAVQVPHPHRGVARAGEEQSAVGLEGEGLVGDGGRDVASEEEAPVPLRGLVPLHQVVVLLPPRRVRDVALPALGTEHALLLLPDRRLPQHAAHGPVLGDGGDVAGAALAV